MLGRTINNKKFQSNINGFALVEFLLIILILVIIGTVGFFVIRHRDIKPVSTASKVSEQTKPTHVGTSKVVKPVIDPTVNWQTIKSSDASFTIKIPANWVSVTCPQVGGSGPNLYVASSQTYLAKCDTDFVGEITFYSSDDQSASAVPTKGVTDQSFSTLPVTINLVSGYKSTNTTSASDALTPNTTYTTYGFYSNHMSFYARYQQLTNAPNDLASFDQIVQTWKF